VVRRHELTDQAWPGIVPLLPANSRPGGQWASHRRRLNKMLWTLATGVLSWRAETGPAALARGDMEEAAT
jgi:transposase